MDREREFEAFASAVREIYYRAEREEWDVEKERNYVDALYLVLGNFGLTKRDFMRYIFRKVSA